MSKDFDQYEASLFAGHFNYFDEVLPAKTDFLVEAAMVTKLIREKKGMSFDMAQRVVRDIVHIQNHYTVTDRPAHL